MLKNFLSKNKKEVWLFGAAFILGLVFLAITYFFGEGRFLWNSDGEGYYRLTLNFIKYHGFFHDISWGPQGLRPPLYMIFTAFWYYLIPNLAFLMLIQNIISAFTVILLYRFGKMLFSETAGFWAAVLYIFESERLQMANQMMSESLFTFLFLIALYYIFKFLLADAKNKFLWLSGIAFGLALLTKPVIQLLPVFIPPLFVWYGFKNRKIKSYLCKSFLLLLIIFAVVSPWLARNWVRFGEFKLSSAGGINLYVVNAANFLESKFGERAPGEISYQEYLSRLALQELGLAVDFSKWNMDSLQLMEFKYEKFFTGKFFGIIRQYPADYAVFHLKRMVTFFIESSASRGYGVMLAGLHLPPRIFYPWLFWGGRALWAIMLLIMVYSYIFKRGKHKKAVVAALFFTALYFAALSSPNRDIPRMREPVAPLIFLLFTNAIVVMCDIKIQSRFIRTM